MFTTFQIHSYIHIRKIFHLSSMLQLQENLADSDEATKFLLYIYFILRGQIKGFNSAIYAIKCQEVVIELYLRWVVMEQ